MVEKKKAQGRESIVVTELPYQVNKARLIEKIAELVKEKKIEGIQDIRDESDREGMRIVIDLKKDEMVEVILNQLYKFTAMEVHLRDHLPGHRQQPAQDHGPENHPGPFSGIP